jgi:hypothetical protein
MGTIGQPDPIVGQAEECPGSALSPDHAAFLRARMKQLDGEAAAPGHRGTYAVVRRGNVDIGVVAVDGELGIWFAALARQGDYGAGAEARHLQRELVRHGFAHSKQGLLAVLCFHLFLPRPERPAPPSRRPRAAEREHQAATRDDRPRTATGVSGCKAVP